MMTKKLIRLQVESHLEVLNTFSMSLGNSPIAIILVGSKLCMTEHKDDSGIIILETAFNIISCNLLQ